MPELIFNGENGYICPIGDENALAEKVYHLRMDAEERVRMGRVNRRIVQNVFSLEAKGRRLVSAFSGEHMTEPLLKEKDIAQFKKDADASPLFKDETKHSHS